MEYLRQGDVIYVTTAVHVKGETETRLQANLPPTPAFATHGAGW